MRSPPPSARPGRRGCRGTAALPEGAGSGRRHSCRWGRRPPAPARVQLRAPHPAVRRREGLGLRLVTAPRLVAHQTGALPAGLDGWGLPPGCRCGQRGWLRGGGGWGGRCAPALSPGLSSRGAGKRGPGPEPGPQPPGCGPPLQPAAPRGPGRPGAFGCPDAALQAARVSVACAEEEEGAFVTTRWLRVALGVGACFNAWAFLIRAGRKQRDSFLLDRELIGHLRCF